MSDPAIRAAERAIGESTDLSNAIGAAREALRPIKKLHNRLSGQMRELGRNVPNDYDYGVRAVLEALAPLIFGDEELPR